MAEPQPETNGVNGENGEPKISKAAAKKAAKKAEKAAIKAAAPPKPAKEKVDLPDRSKAAPSTDPNVDVMDETFDVGWLKDVYQIKPAEKDVRTRFPPEPNGFLHIGHAKAIAVNFGFAKHYGGRCFLRYDDTNPEAEEEKYFTSIKETVEWLGYEPYQITHSSDHFDRLYELAEVLVKKDGAYVCHCTAEEIRHQKGERVDEAGKKTMVGERYACSHRDRPIEESLIEFRKMRDDKYEPKAAVLRMKMALLTSGNTNMWDLPAYRILEREKRHHHKTGSNWAIYPTYDFTHCLCDAFEEISHSLCTTEFRTARESYDWLVDILRDHLPAKPQQREYSRLNVEGTVLSKRKILKLVKDGYVRDWDDPRLYTIIALRRRGIPPGAIRAFVAELGVSDALSTSIQLVRLETVVRKYLEKTVPRLMLIPDPLLIIIDNLPSDHGEEIEMEFMPRDASFGSHKVPFTSRVYIDRSDFREEADDNFFRLAVGKTVGLLNVPFPIRATSVEKDESGRVTVAHATYEKPADGSGPEKPKAFIQWVADAPHASPPSPVKCEVRMFNPLFRSSRPDDAPEGFLSDINPDSETVYPNAVMETGFRWVHENGPWPKDHVPNLHPGAWGTRFQGMRVAYFALDRESDVDGGKVVLNKIVALKEDSGKKVWYA